MKHIKSILAIVLAALLLTACNTTAEDTTTTAATTPAVTASPRDTLTRTDLTELERGIIEAMWAKYKYRAPENYTIDQLYVPRLWQCGDAYLLYAIDFKMPLDWETYDIFVGKSGREYLIINGTDRSLSLYYDGELYHPQTALDQGIVTEEEFRVFWEDYVAKNQQTYDNYYENNPPSTKEPPSE